MATIEYPGRRPLAYRGRHRRPEWRETLDYYVKGFWPTMFEILTWLRYPRKPWGWPIAIILFPVMSALWLQFQLKYGDDWYIWGER